MRAHQFLLEYDRSREQQRIETLPAYQTRLKQDPEFSLERLESADPTPQRIYVPRLATWWLRGAKLEDLISRGADALEKFVQLKQKNLLKPEHKDINGFKQFTEFETTLSGYQLPGQSAQAPENRGRFKQIYRDEQLIVVQLLDKTAARWWGQGTKWCTAAKNNNMFDDYAHQGPIYVIIDRVANAKYQYWWNKNNVYDMEFTDAQDDPYHPQKLRAFAQLQKIFQPLCSHIMWNTNPTESEQLAAVQQKGLAIRHISNPSEAVQLAAVQKDGWAIGYITDPTDAAKLAAVRQTGWAIVYITNPSEPVQLAAVQQDSKAIQWISNPTEPVQLAAVQQDSKAIQWIRNPTPKVQALHQRLTGAK